jgi:hypothetical protein
MSKKSGVSDFWPAIVVPQIDVRTPSRGPASAEKMMSKIRTYDFFRAFPVKLT